MVTLVKQQEEDFVSKVFLQNTELFPSDLLVNYLNLTNLTIIKTELAKIVKVFTDRCDNDHHKFLFNCNDDMRISTAENSEALHSVSKRNRGKSSH